MTLPANWHRAVYFALAILGLLALLGERAIAAGQIALPAGSGAVVLFACFVVAALLRPFYESLAKDAGIDPTPAPVPLPVGALVPAPAAPVPLPAPTTPLASPEGPPPAPEPPAAINGG